MLYKTWFKRFEAACEKPVVMQPVDLKAAWKDGETPAGVAVANDEIALEHELADAELLAA